MPAPGNCWATDSWDVEAWAADTWISDAPPPDDPHLVLTPSSFTFSGVEGGSNPSDKQIVISNSGGGSLTPSLSAITYDDGSGWLSLDLTAGVVTASIDLSALTAGVYVAHFDVEDSGADNSPQTVDVTMSVGSAGSGANTSTARIRRRNLLATIWRY